MIKQDFRHTIEHPVSIVKIYFFLSPSVSAFHESGLPVKWSIHHCDRKYTAVPQRVLFWLALLLHLLFFFSCPSLNRSFGAALFLSLSPFFAFCAASVFMPSAR